MIKAVSRFVLASALAVGAVFVTSEPARAGGCDWYSPCGEAQNSTPWGMHVTTTLGAGPHWCDVWNINGGSSPAWQHSKCTQQYLAPGGHHGGGNVDVDAFTFNDRGYYMTFQSRVWHAKGVWTKITNLQDVECRNSGGAPDCWIS